MSQVKKLLDLVYTHPGGVHTAMALFFFCKVSFEKHPNLGIEASSLRFFLEKEGLLRRLTGKERAIDLEGASMVVKDFEEASAHNDVVTSPGYEDPIIRIAKEVPFVQIL